MRGGGSWHDRQRPGRPRKLNHRQRRKLKRILRRGAVQYGYPTKLWTLKRVAEVIEKEFEVRYNVTHVWRILRSLGFTAQVPLLRALERDEDYIHYWIEEKWPEIMALAEMEYATLIFIDESCVQNHPNVKQTWAPKGSRPELRVKEGRRGRLSLISGVRVDGELFFSVHGHPLTGWDVIRFLRRLLKEMEGGRIIILWDNASIHKCRETKRFLERNRSKIITRCFPSYAPELNPDESIWDLAKYHDLANWCPTDISEMRRVVNREFRLLSSQQERVASAMRNAKIPLPPIEGC